jgi:hypothetical protein
VAQFRAGVGSSVGDAYAELTNICSAFLERAGRVVVFEHHTINLSDQHDYLPGPTRVTSDSVVQLACSGTSRAELEAMIDEWTVLPIYNAFLADLGPDPLGVCAERARDSPIDVALIASNLRGFICGAYDQEGFVFWRAPESSAESSLDNSYPVSIM